jgi:phospholipid-binding lipoprotein MlaA
VALMPMLVGCASLPSGHPSPRDPFERVNRSVFRFNSALDRALLRPLAQGSRRVPQPISQAIFNFVGNLTYPLTIVNELLQARFHDATRDVARLVVNTTVGIGGLLDPATGIGLERHCEDFGITLGKWGVPSGPFLMIPFLGPSSVRDAVGMVPEIFAYVVVPGPAIGIPLLGANALEQRKQLLASDKLISSAYDPYAFERSIYLQVREFKVGTPARVPSVVEDPGSPNCEKPETGGALDCGCGPR